MSHCAVAFAEPLALLEFRLEIRHFCFDALSTFETLQLLTAIGFEIMQLLGIKTLLAVLPFAGSALIQFSVTGSATFFATSCAYECSIASVMVPSRLGFPICPLVPNFAHGALDLLLAVFAHFSCTAP